jgi:MFS family permease
LILVWALGIHYAFGVFFKPLIADFGWSRAVTSGAVSLSFVVQGLSSIALGAFNDRSGPRWVLSLSGLILGSGYMLMSQVNSLWQLYLFYGIFIGAGLGGIFVPLTSTVARWFIARRSAMTGITVAGIGIGTLIAPVVANWLIANYDWRRSYLMLGIAVLVIVIASAQFLRPRPRFGEMPASETAASTPDTGGISLKEALRTGQFWIGLGIFICFGICLYVILVHIVPFATDLHISGASAAGVLSAIGAVSIVGKVIFGKIGDKIGCRSLYLICFTLMTISLLWLVSADAAWKLYSFAVVFGFAYAGCAVAHSPVVAWLFGLRAHGIILGALNLGYTVGGAVGPLVTGYIFDVKHSYSLAFLISAGIAGAGLIFALALRPTKKLLIIAPGL